MSNLTIVANIVAKPGQAEFVNAELDKLIPITRSEDGCLRYDLHQNNDDPNHFMFYETWTSRELWQAHLNAPHIAAYRKATKSAVGEFTLHEMTMIDGTPRAAR